MRHGTSRHDGTTFVMPPAAETDATAVTTTASGIGLLMGTAPTLTCVLLLLMMMMMAAAVVVEKPKRAPPILVTAGARPPYTDDDGGDDCP